MNANTVIEKALKQVRDNGYDPVALWYNKDESEFVITTKYIDLRKFNWKLMKTYKINDFVTN